MGRVEAVIFAAPEPVSRPVLSSLVGKECNLDKLLADVQRELAQRPYELVEVAGGWHHRTRPEYAPTIQASGVLGHIPPDLSQRDLTVLMAIAYFQPITRGDLSHILGKAVSRDVISALSRKKFIAPGPRSPRSGAPYTYVTTGRFLTEFNFQSLSSLPDIEQLTEAGLLDRARLEAEEDPVGRFEANEDQDNPSEE